MFFKVSNSSIYYSIYYSINITENLYRPQFNKFITFFLQIQGFSFSFTCVNIMIELQQTKRIYVLYGLFANI